MDQQSIIGFLNICLLPGWEKSYSKLWGALNKSHLYENTEIIYCAILGQDDNFPRSRLPSKMKIIYSGVPNDYEKPLLRKMREIAQQQPTEALIWYGHTKGITKIGTWCEENVWDWLDYLLYFNFEQWRNATEVLKNKWNTYGVNLRLKPEKHYSGNFWWSKSSYIKTLPQEIGPAYLDSEMWIGRSPEFCGYNAKESYIDHYRDGYKRGNYENESWINMPFTQTIKNKIAELKQLPSTWRGHIEFAIWLIYSLRPFDPLDNNLSKPIIVDLGISSGTSLFSWAALNIGTIIGINMTNHNNQIETIYTYFKEKYRQTDNIKLTIPDSAFNHINQSIDILHLDGIHTYEAVKRDFETWWPQVNEQGIVIFHDIISFPDTIGKFFNELQYEKIYMNHSGGVGIISRSHDTLYRIQTCWINRIIDYGPTMSHSDYPQLTINKI